MCKSPVDVAVSAARGVSLEALVKGKAVVKLGLGYDGHLVRTTGRIKNREAQTTHRPRACPGATGYLRKRGVQYTKAALLLGATGYQAS